MVGSAGVVQGVIGLGIGVGIGCGGSGRDKVG